MKFEIPNILDINDLSKYFPVSEDQISILINDSYKEKIIEVKKIYKYAGKFRDVAIIHDMGYKLILKIITVYFQKLYKPPIAVHGYIKGGSIVKNAQQHLNKRFVIRSDISNFFYSITKNMIKPMYKSYGANQDICEVLSELTTFREVLFPGLNTSPYSPICIAILWMNC